MAALAMCACALGPAASAEASTTPLDQVTGAVTGATGKTTAQVDGTVNATAGQAGAVVDGVRQAAVPALQDAGAQARQSVDALSATPRRGVAAVTDATRAATSTVAAAGVALSADDGGSAAAAAIRETTAPAGRAHRLRMTSRRPEGAATSARAGTGTKAARGPAAPASVAPSGSAGAERQESAAAPRVFTGDSRPRTREPATAALRPGPPR